LYTKSQSENLKQRDYLGDPGINRSIMLQCTLKKYSVWVCTGIS